MRKDGDRVVWYSPTDLVRFIESPYVSFMDRRLLEQPGSLVPDDDDPMLKLLAGMGELHEATYRAELVADGRELAEIPRSPNAAALTRQALGDLKEVVFQARLELAPFAGYADFLERSRSAERGPYQVWDTKLATRTKPHYLIQLCCYAEMLEAMGNDRPGTIGVILGTGERVPYRTAEFFYYYRGLKQAFLAEMERFDAGAAPTPVARADHGRWTSHAERHLAEVDHLVQVAGITTGQILKLEAAGIATMAMLATTEIERVPKLDAAVFARLKEQAALQRESEGADLPAYRIVHPAPEDPRRGLALLPPASPQDVYFDIEGDPLVEGGLEYLWGATHLEDGQPLFWDAWAFDQDGEKKAFERFVDWVFSRWRQDPAMHVYHYAPYEVTALKKLMGRYATREEEVDHLLRAGVLVDLFQVVRQGLRVGTKGYSLKDVEKLYLRREGAVESGGASIVEFERFLASGEDRDWRQSPILKDIRDYNQVDCDSTWKLTKWLRARQVESGISFLASGAPAEEVAPPLSTEAPERKDLSEALLASSQNLEGTARCTSEMLGYLLEFHRREEKPIWWSFFERHDMTSEQHVDDPTCIGQATLDSGPFAVKRSEGYWYRFDPDQDTKIEPESNVYVAGLREKGMRVTEMEEGRLLVVVGPAAQKTLPEGRMPESCSFLKHSIVGPGAIKESIERIAKDYASRGELPLALPNLFAGEPPPIAGHTGGPLVGPDEVVLQGVGRVIKAMKGGTLAIQGPPGSGKTYTASHVIKDLLADGKNIGVVSNSHEVVTNVLRAVSKRMDGDLSCFKVGGPREHLLYDECPGAVLLPGGGPGAAAYTGGLVGGTAWFFSRADMVGRLDYLFVDEAGQVSLANLVGVSPSASNIVLLGDQMQLSQPLQGTHPGDSGQSALEYALGEHKTVPPELGIFLPTTYRLHPGICRFISGAIYEDRLEPHAGTALRVVKVPERAGLVPVEAGILFSSVEHSGNTQASDEEVVRIQELTEDLVGRTLTNLDGQEAGPLTLDGILFVTPFNMQARRIRAAIPGARVASVDKFQGQEAPVVILSLCRSAGESGGGGRGLEFVLDPNRMNVAVSRAQSLAIVVGDARIALTKGNSLDVMRRMNLLARLIAEGTPRA